jgi:hypothetical protein
MLSMMTYRDLLAQRTWWELRAIALAHRWHFDTHWSKAQAVDYLTKKLTQAPVLRSTLDVLDPKALETLQVLHLTQTPRSARQFLETFGPIRPYKPWQDDERYHPWRDPISPAEKLWHLGLIFEVKCSTGTLMMLPHEVRQLLPMGTPQPEPPDTHPPEPTLILDLVHFLAYLQGHRVRALHGRWLAPTHVRARRGRRWAPGSSATRVSRPPPRRRSRSRWIPRGTISSSRCPHRRRDRRWRRGRPWHCRFSRPHLPNCTPARTISPTDT